MTLREIILAGLFAAITCVLSIIVIPLGPVPFTLQVFAVVIAGAIGGMRVGFFSQLVYLLLGAIGLPVYSGMKGGIGHLAGPTGGYIFGFVLAALFIGIVTDTLYKELDNKTIIYVIQVLAMLVGVAIIYGVGMMQLKIVLSMTYEKAFTVGVLPFIGIDTIKVIAAFFVSIPIRQALLKANLLHIRERKVIA